MIGRGSGRVVTIAPQLAIKGGESLTHYRAPKAGIIGLTKALGQTLGPNSGEVMP